VSLAALDNLASDVRYAMRGLWRSPLFTLVALLTLAIGCGANTAIFSVVDGVLLKPLPYPNPEDLVAVWHVAPGAPGLADVSGGLRLSPSMLVTYQEENRTFDKIGMWVENTVTVTGGGEPEQVSSLAAMGDLFQTLGVPPLLGRWLDAGDEAPDAARRAVLTYPFWQRRFGGDPNVIGRTLTINSVPNEIVGVMPRGFRVLDTQTDLILPIPSRRTGLTPYPFFGKGVARLKPGVSIEQANADLARLLPRWVERFPYADGRDARAVYLDGWKIAPAIRPLKQDVVGDVGTLLWVVMGTIGVVLVIAGANVMNLLLVRAEKRRPELAVRGALGAGSGRIVRALVIESTLMGAAGGILGLGLAGSALAVIKRLAPATLPRLDSIALDGRAVLFSLVISTTAGALLGLLPALRYAAPSLVAVALRAGGRSGLQGRAQHRSQGALVVGQVALALVLIVSSVLMIRTFQALRTVEPGFTDARTLQTARLVIPPQVERDPQAILRLENTISDAVAHIPGVSSVGFASAVPMDGTYGNWDGIFVEGQSARDRSVTLRSFRYVSPSLFRTTGARLVAGREFEPADLDSDRMVVLVSENLAREIWHEPTSALGKRISTNGRDFREIVGVVQDTYDNGLQERPPTIVYWPLYLKEINFAQSSGTFVIRSALAGQASFVRQIEQAVWSANASLAVTGVRTMQEYYDRSLALTSFTLVMLVIAGAAALVLGVIGLYGTIAYVVSQRRREIAIRLALGAQQGAVTRTFVRYGAGLASVGVLIGLGAAAAVTRFMTALLYGVGALDPLTYVGVAAALAAAAVLASWLPARRAAAIDPAEALLAE
jgi:predicted permease